MASPSALATSTAPTSYRKKNGVLSNTNDLSEVKRFRDEPNERLRTWRMKFNNTGHIFLTLLIEPNRTIEQSEHNHAIWFDLVW